MSNTQPIKPIISGKAERVYGLVDPMELQRKQQQQQIQQRKEMEKRYSMPNRNSTQTLNQDNRNSMPEPSVSVLSYMYPVSNGTEHRRVFEGPSSVGGFYQPVNVPIQDLVNRRDDLIRQQNEAPENYLIRLALEDCESQISHWAVMNQQYFDSEQPSQSKGAAFKKPPGMSRKEFNKSQPWVRRDSLKNGLILPSGVGKKLLKQMGWREGLGVGRVTTGPSEPVVPDNFRGAVTDRRGLGATNEPKSSPVVASSGKHPVSVLMELCAKNKWTPPEFFEVVNEGPSHRPHFIMKVQVNGVEYRPTTASSTKKDAKSMAAVTCLQALGVVSSGPTVTSHASLFGGAPATKNMSTVEPDGATQSANHLQNGVGGEPG